MSKPMISEKQRFSFLKAIAGESRLRIVNVLTKRRAPVPVTELANALGMTHSAVSHQLKIMRRQRIVKSKKNGQQSLYRLDPERERAVRAVVASFDLLAARKKLPVRSIDGI